MKPEPFRWRRADTAVSVMMLALIAMLVILAKAHAADLPQSDLIEVSAATTLGPDSTAKLTGAMALRLGVLPKWVPLAGEHAAFIGGGYANGYAAIFGDVALQAASEDTSRLRFGAWFWAPEGDWSEPDWALVLRYPALAF